MKWPQSKTVPDALLVRCTTASSTATWASTPAQPLRRAHHDAAVPRETIDPVHALQSAFGRLPDEEVCRVDKVRECLVSAAIDFPIQDQVTPL